MALDYPGGPKALCRCVGDAGWVSRLLFDERGKS